MHFCFCHIKRNAQFNVFCSKDCIWGMLTSPLNLIDEFEFSILALFYQIY